MNTIYSLLFISLFTITIFANPRKQVIVVDMDDVFVNARTFNIGAHIVSKSFFKIPEFSWNMLTKSRFNKRVQGIFRNKYQTEIGHGFTFKMAALAREYKPLRRLYDSMVHAMQRKRTLSHDVIALFKELKDKDYTIIVATNRDRIGFEITAKKLGFDQLYHGKRLFDRVIVSQSVDFIAATTVNGKRFSKLIYDHTLDDYITVAAGFKPNKDYYQIVRNVVDNTVAQNKNLFDVTSPQIIFFDDKKVNIEGANKSDLNITAYQVPAKKRAHSMRKNLAFLAENSLT